MTPTSGRTASGFVITPRALLLLCWMWASIATAAPGAHGPGGEHLDAPGGNMACGGRGLQSTAGRGYCRVKREAFTGMTCFPMRECRL